MCRLTSNSVDSDALREPLGNFPTGVAVVTTAPQGLPPAGMTINSFHSISLRPALVGWCIDRGAASFRTFSRCGAFTLSFLDENQQDTARRFATRGADKFEGLDTSDPAGTVMPGACAWLRCRLYRQVALGDHLLLVGEVIETGAGAGHPMVFARGRFSGVSRKPAPDSQELVGNRAASAA